MLAERELDVLAWLLTYAAHSSVLLGLAWLVARRLRAERAREIVWKAALLGGVLTASLPGAPGTRWTLALGLGPDPVAAPAALDTVAMPARPPVAPSEGLHAAEPSVAATARSAHPWPRWTLAAWSLGALTLLLALAGAHRRLAHRLRGARELEDEPLSLLLDALRREAGIRRRVRLAVAPRLDAPIAVGVLRPRIYVPTRALTELTQDLQRTMLAHELGHVARHDPLWLGLARLIEGLLFFQPLNRVARRRLRESAEYLCDEWAVSQTGDRIGLARCLTEVAGWLVGRRGARLACGMASPRSPLGARVERILDAHRKRDRRPAWIVPACAALLGTAALYAPGFSGTAPAPPEPPSEIREPAARPLGRLAALAALANELDDEQASLDASLATLREEAARRAVPAELTLRLAHIERRAHVIRERGRRIGVLLELFLEQAARNESLTTE